MKAITAYDLALRHKAHAEELYEHMLQLIKISANNGLFNTTYTYDEEDLIYHHYKFIVEKLLELGYECYFEKQGQFKINWDKRTQHHGYPDNPYLIQILTP